jgi:hypothetical protein
MNNTDEQQAFLAAHDGGNDRAWVADLDVALNRAGLELPILRLPVGEGNRRGGGRRVETTQVNPGGVTGFAAIGI